MADRITNTFSVGTEGLEETTLTGGSPTVDTTKLRNGRPTLLLAGAASSAAIAFPLVPHLASFGNDLLVSFYVCFTDVTPGTGWVFWQARESGGGDTAISLALTAAGALAILDDADGAVASTSTPGFVADRFHLVQIRFTESATGDAKVWVDREEKMTATGEDFLASSPIDEFVLSGGIADSGDVNFSDCVVQTGVTSDAERWDHHELVYVQNDKGATATPDAGLTGSAASDLDTGTWNLVGETPLDNSAGNVGIYGSAGQGTVDLPAPLGSGLFAADDEIVAMKSIFNAKRTGGPSSTHSGGMGDSDDGDSAPTREFILLNGTYANYIIFRDTVLPTATQKVRQGFATDGNQDFDCGEMWAVLLRVPHTTPPPHKRRPSTLLRM